jgi:RNA polymerase-associated protein CTR9
MEERKRARDEAMAWTAAAKAESDDEREKKPAKKSAKKAKIEGDSADEGGEIEGEVKKKRKGKLRKAESNGNGEVSMEEDDALFSADEADQPKKVITLLYAVYVLSR